MLPVGSQTRGNEDGPVKYIVAGGDARQQARAAVKKNFQENDILTEDVRREQEDLKEKRTRDLRGRGIAKRRGWCWGTHRRGYAYFFVWGRGLYGREVGR